MFDNGGGREVLVDDVSRPWEGAAVQGVIRPSFSDGHADDAWSEGDLDVGVDIPSPSMQRRKTWWAVSSSNPWSSAGANDDVAPVTAS